MFLDRSSVECRAGLESLTLSGGTGLFFVDGSFVSGNVVRNAEGLTESFEIRDGVEIPVGEYWNNQVSLQYVGNRSRRLSFSGGLFAGGFYGGSIVAPSLSSEIPVHQRLVLGVQYSHNILGEAPPTRQRTFLVRVTFYAVPR